MGIGAQAGHGTDAFGSAHGLATEAAGAGRGAQYAANDYVAILRSHGFQISMSRRGNPYDNALCESFLKTLKYEQVYREDYRDYAEANTGIEHFLEKVYNAKRLHSALGYRPPAEFEASLVAGVITGAAA